MLAESPSEEFAPVIEPQAQTLDANGEPVKKRRGRPPGSKNKTYAGQPVGSRRSGRDSLKTQIGAMLVTYNMPLRMLPMTSIYALDVTEIEALAQAIDTECQNNANFRKYIIKALNVQGVSSLVGVVAVIAGRRVVRAGLIPDEILEPIGGKEGADAVIAQILPMMTAAPVPQVTVVTPPAEENASV